MGQYSGNHKETGHPTDNNGKVVEKYSRWCYRITYTPDGTEGADFEPFPAGRSFGLDFPQSAKIVRGKDLPGLPGNLDPATVPKYGTTEKKGGTTVIVEPTNPPPVQPPAASPAPDGSKWIDICFLTEGAKAKDDVPVSLQYHAAGGAWKPQPFDGSRDDVQPRRNMPGPIASLREPPPSELVSLLADYEGQKLASLLSLATFERPSYEPEEEPAEPAVEPVAAPAGNGDVGREQLPPRRPRRAPRT
jgi:hypothetical protein